MNHDISRSVSGAADVEAAIDSLSLAEGDILIGLAASGIHSDSLPLVRSIFHANHFDLNAPLEALDGRSLNQALLEPGRSHDSAVNSLLEHSIHIHAIHPVTGGLSESVPRMMVPGLTAQIILHRLPHLPVFDLIQQAGHLSDRDMYTAFSMGLGMILAVPADQALPALAILREAGEDACRIGMVVRGDEGAMLV